MIFIKTYIQVEEFLTPRETLVIHLCKSSFKLLTQDNILESTNIKLLKIAHSISFFESVSDSVPCSLFSSVVSASKNSEFATFSSLSPEDVISWSSVDASLVLFRPVEIELSSSEDVSKLCLKQHLHIKDLTVVGVNCAQLNYIACLL